MPGRRDTSDDDVIVVGARRHPLRDLYHGLLRLGWISTLVVIACAYLTINAIFALIYLRVGGITNARTGSFVDAFFFSVQTMGTIGYGSLFPQSVGANVVVVAESVVGLVVTALATGLVFAKFSLSAAMIRFSREVTISLINGVPTLSVRVGNDRSNTIADARIHIGLVRTERTLEGMVFYRVTDVLPVRDRSPWMRRSWSVMHVLDEKSPLFGATPESLLQCEAELMVTIVGTDDTSLQPVHARRRYTNDDIVWGVRHADVLGEHPDGKRLYLDVRNFDVLLPMDPTENFPYPREIDLQRLRKRKTA